MFEAMGLFLLDQVFEDADIFGLQNLDRECLIRIERLIWLVAENETVEVEKLRRDRLLSGHVQQCFVHVHQQL
jgi:hypothetical protein